MAGRQKAEAKDDLEATRQERSEDMTYKVDTEALCVQKTADFNVRQKLRGEELEAIKKAMETIGSGAVKGSSEKHLPALLLTEKCALAKLRTHIADFLAGCARVTGSSLLAQVSSRVASDPFKEVHEMIKDFINKLTQEEA